MSSVSDSTQIRIGVSIKADLEKHRDSIKHYGHVSHSDAIQDLLEYRAISEQQKATAAKQADAEKKRRGLEDLTLGRDRKELLVVFKDKLGLPDLNAVIDVMIRHFEKAESLSIDTVNLLLSLQKERSR